MQRPNATNSEKQLQRDDFIVSKTDIRGKIIYGNKRFIEISGYGEHELLNMPHSILRHSDMPKIIFKVLWDAIQNKQEIFAYVKNLCKDGSYYWVFANVTATLDERKNIRDFHSVRRKASDKAMAVIPVLYADLLMAERSGGIENSKKTLDNFLMQKGMNYEKFVLTLQQ